MTDVAVIPFYWCADEERGAITRKIFHHYAYVAEQTGITFLGVGSEQELSEAFWTEWFPPDTYVEFSQAGWPNSLPSGGSPEIRAKFNFSLGQARRFNPDRVWLIQSDDMLTWKFFEQSAADLVGVGPGEDGGCYFWRHDSDEFLWWDGVFPYLESRDAMPFCGGNIGFGRALLEKVDWQPYVHDEDEMGFQRWARAEGFSFEARRQYPAGFRWWLVKGGKCLNPWGVFFRQGYEFPFVPVDPGEVVEFQTYWAGL